MQHLSEHRQTSQKRQQEAEINSSWSNRPWMEQGKYNLRQQKTIKRKLTIKKRDLTEMIVESKIDETRGEIKSKKRQADDKRRETKTATQVRPGNSTLSR